MLDSTRCPNLDEHSPKGLSLLWLGNAWTISLSCNLHDGALVIIITTIINITNEMIARHIKQQARNKAKNNAHQVKGAL